MSAERWQKEKVGGEEFELLNLEHPTVEKQVIAEMEAGVDVYYDRRWSATAVLTDWLGENRELFSGKDVLVIGAGVGAEGLLLAKYGRQVFLNDLAPAALELSAQQMKKNGLANFELLEGRYEHLEIPKVDLVVAGFLIYNQETLAAMEEFLKGHQGKLVLVNERLAPFPQFLADHPHTIVFDDESGAVGALLG